jgi:cell division protein ZapA
VTADAANGRSAPQRGNTVKVTILGQEYPVRADLDPDYIREIAEIVDERMRMIYQADPNRPTLRIAILAALNLSDEIYSLRREKQEIAARYEQKVQEFTEHLNRVLSE